MKFTLLLICLSISQFTADEVKKSEYLPYEIYMENYDREKAPLEKDVCLKGAYIGDENNYADIKAFENYIDIENDIYISRVSKGENLPLREITECYAKGKIPMIEIKGDYGISQSMAAAKTLGNMNIPIFVEIRSDADVYNCLADIFREYAPRAVMVYGMDTDNTTYDYPKEELVDWVGLNAEEKTHNGYIISEYENISKWCGYFKDKAIMLNISVPNFSTDRCSYVYNEAANEITRLYDLVSEYSNIGAVNYISCVKKNDGMVSCNYRITENILLTGAYKKSVENMTNNRYWSKTPYVAYVSDKKVIVSNDALKSCKISGKYINSGYSEINASGFNKSERKVFVKS